MYFLLNQDYQSFDIHYNVEPDYWEGQDPPVGLLGEGQCPPPISYSTGADFVWSKTLAIQHLAIKPQMTDSTIRI